MKFHTIFKAAGLAGLVTGSVSALAHDGHGLFGSHWHATDALGFVALAGLIVIAVWLSRK